MKSNLRSMAKQKILKHDSKGLFFQTHWIKTIKEHDIYRVHHIDLKYHMHVAKFVMQKDLKDCSFKQTSPKTIWNEQLQI